MKNILFLLFLSAMPLMVDAQDTIYLDAKDFIAKDKALAKEYVLITKDKESKINRAAFYSMEHELKQISEYLKFGKKPKDRILHGKSCYKFAGSQQDSLVCYYDKGLLKGGMNYYYPNGKQKVECVYKEGLLDGVLIDYYLDGSIRHKDTYKKGNCTESNCYSPAGELLGPDPYYVRPQPAIGYDGLIQLLGQRLTPPIEAMKKGGHWKIYVEIIIDSTGKIEDVRSIYTENQGLVPSIPLQVAKIIEGETFKPALMDKQPVRGSIICPFTFHSTVTTSRMTNNNFK